MAGMYPGIVLGVETLEAGRLCWLLCAGTPPL